MKKNATCEVYTEIDIDAPAQKVWDLLMDFKNMPKWNPIIRAIKGKPRVGGHLFVLFIFEGMGPSPLAVKVNVFEEGRELTWTGNVPHSKLLAGRHSFNVVPLGENSSRFIHTESFTGLLVPYVEKLLDVRLKPNYVAMNMALKAESEKK